MSLFESCRDHFGTDNLYEVLCVDKTASESEIKRGYHRASLKCHPDRVEKENKEDATKKFQTVGKVYSILSDKEKRAIYDETGDIDEEDDIQQDRDWMDYWRLLFPKITVDDIKNYEKNYKGSEDEKMDLKDAYLRFEGDMDQIMDNVVCSCEEDEPRYQKIIKSMIKSKEVPEYSKFTKETKAKKSARKRKAAKEAAEAEDMKKELGVGENDSLQALIQRKHQGRAQQADNFLADLEAKYAKPKTKGRKK